MSRLAVFFMSVCVCAFCVRAQGSDKVRELTDIIRKGPSLYRTEGAAQALGHINSAGGVAAATGPDALAAIKQSLRAAISLGDMGEKAKDAVSTLIEMFPQAEHAVVIYNAQYGPGMGGFDDWVQTYVVSEKNKFVMGTPLMEYHTLSKCEKWVEASASTDIHQRRMAGSRIISAIADIYITLRINAAVCALAQITGYDAGNTRESWRKWYSTYGASSGYGATTYQASPAGQPSPQVKVTTISAFPIVDYTPGLRYQIELTTGDRVTGIVETVDENSITVKIDDGGRYNYQKSFIRNRILLSNVNQYYPQTSAPVSAPVTSSPSSSLQIPYEKLLDFTYSGKLMQVVLNNGSAYIGTLGVVDATLLHLNVDGAEMPIYRSVILRISVIEPPAPKAPAPAPADAPSDAPKPW
jgi:small nuclear ribonucleoprotein (snRNP)-like protein